MTPRDTEAPKLDGQGLSSLSLAELAEQLRGLGPDAFRARYPLGFLVLQHAPPSDDDWIDLQTSEASLPRPADLGDRRQAVRCVPLRKSARNAFGDKITVGRARNNDVIIRAPKISKLHATFIPDRRGGLKLQDMGSLNGTVVNGSRLQEKQRLDLASGDLISFWRYVFELVSTAEMLGRLTGR